MTSIGDVEAALAKRRLATVARLTPEAIAWLALPPLWTEELARVAGFPARDLPALMAECEGLGWCTRRTGANRLGAREAAELLTGLAVRLNAEAPQHEWTTKMVGAAEQALRLLPASRPRTRLAERLSAAVASRHAPPPEPPLPAARAIGEAKASLATLLSATGHRPEFTSTLAGLPEDALLHAIRVIVAERRFGLPEQVLPRLTTRLVEALDGAAAARVLTELAALLPPETVLTAVRGLAEQLADPQESPVAAVYLAAAAVIADDLTLGLAVCDRITEGGMRASALAEVANRLAAAGAHRRAGWVIERVLAVLGEGSTVDLPAAADAAERLAGTGRADNIEPILRLATATADRFDASDLGPLTRLVSAATAAGAMASAGAITRQAIRLATGQPDPVVRANGLVRLLPVVDKRDRHNLAGRALDASRQVTDQAQRARMLAALVPALLAHGGGSAGADAVDELLPLCLGGQGGGTFWAPDAIRSTVLESLEAAQGSVWLRQVAVQVGRAVSAPSARPSAPDSALRWATLAERLAEADEGECAGGLLLDKVSHAVSSGSAAEAGGWVLAGRRLLAVVRGTYETSLLLAERRVELVNRRAHDRRLLERFLPRAEQLDAFDQLVDGDDSQWALHYLGYGGVGKTMLLRHLCARVAPERGWLPARVDFDHLNPEFPWRRPGQLLLELLEELESYAPAEASRRYYHEAREHLRTLEWWRDPAAGRPDLSRAVERFCAYLQSLPRPVLIVLDTCEELAKFQPANAVLPQLDAAFKLLEAVHRDVPTVRVVFGGRRPLAGAGAGGWQIERSRVHAQLPARKDYLAVHVVCGFSEQEARYYLSNVERLTVDEPVVQAVLRRSVERIRAPYLAAANRADGECRYNPFDLAFYAAALRDDPGAAHTDLAATSWLTNRIADQLGPGAALLPAVLAMRRFDVDMLAAAADAAGVALDDVWPQFAGAEWVLSRVDPALPATFLEIDQGLLSWLDNHYGWGRPRLEYEHATRGLGPRLAALVRRRRPRELAAAHVEAAMRCLPPPAAAALCDELALRVATDGAWMWAYTVIGRLLDTEGVLAAPDHPAHASALALYATAAAHLDPVSDKHTIWQAVTAAATAHPVPATRDWLRARAAVLGRPGQGTEGVVGALVEGLRFVASLSEPGTPDDKRQMGLWLLGTVLVGAERMLDELDGRRPADTTQAIDAPHRLRAALGDLVRSGAGAELDRPDPVHGPLLQALHARLLWHCGDHAAAGAELAAVLRHLPAGPLTPSVYLSADRPVPVQWRSRLRLLAAARSLAAPQPQWLDDALADGVRRVDADRLASWLLDHRLDREPVPVGTLTSVEQHLGDRPPPAAAVPVHGDVPPLRVSLARGWLALGEAKRARAVLGPPGAFAETPAEQAALDTARIDIARRMRLADADVHLRVSLLGSKLARQRARATEASMLLDKATPVHSAGTLHQPLTLHLWWCSRQELPAPGTLRDAVQEAGRTVLPDSAGHALALDAAELALRTDDRRLARRILAAMATAPRPLDADAETIGRLDLRACALAALIGEHRRLPIWPQRRDAELSLEEGELLALRLPAAGHHLLLRAVAGFTAARDPIGALIAGTAAGLAKMRAEDVDPNERNRLKEAYRAVAYLRPELPTWRQLIYGANDPEDPATDPPDWRGWLLRLRLLISAPGSARRRQLSKGGHTTPPPELRSRQGRRPARPTPLEEVPPPAWEISAAPAPRAGAAGKAWVRSAGVSAGPQQRGQLARKVAMTRLAAAAGATVLAVIAEVLSRSYAGPLGSAENVQSVARFSVYFIIFLGLVLTGRHIAGSGAQHNRVTIGVAEADDGVLAIRASGVRARRWPLPARRLHAATATRTPGRTAHIELRPVIPVIAATAHPDQLLPVALRVPPTLAALGWEAALAELLPADARVQPWRDFGPPALAAGRRSVDHTWWAAVPEQWTRLVDGTRATRPARLASLSELRDGDRAVLMATAIDTTVGRQLVVRHTEGRGRRVWLRPDELQAKGVLLVVCGEPGSRGASRGADHLAAQDLRGCAADLMVAGAGAVVVLPSMPEHFLRHALAGIDPDSRLGEALLNQVYRIRKDLRAGGLAGLAHELTLMTRGL